MTVYVCHIDNAPSDAVYIGRNAIHGNPIFGNPIKLTREADRLIVIEGYKRYFSFALVNDVCFHNNIITLVARAQCGDLYLACHCAPLACHGDVIKAYIDRSLQR